MNSLRKSTQIAPRVSSAIRTMCGDKKASSDNAGAIRAAGGGFAKLEIAHEEEYFYKQRQQQLLDLKNKKLNEEQFRNDAIKSHQEAIQRHKEAISKIRK